MYKESVKFKNEFPYQRQFISLLYACPFVNTYKTCVLSKIRNKKQTINLNEIEKFEKEEIFQLLSEHHKCFIKRTRSNGIEPTTKNCHRQHNKIAYLKWTGKGDQDILASELKKRGWIKSLKNFSKLFDNKGTSLRVYLNNKYKYEFVYLLFRLKEEDYIHPVNSKGYFKIAEKQIMDYSKNIFKNNSLKKINSKITNNPLKYIDIIGEVENIMTTISHHQNGLFYSDENKLLANNK